MSASNVANPWGEQETKYFYELTPQTVFEAVERLGVRCSGRVLQLNSMENRVYDVELESEFPEIPSFARPGSVVAKFYRPGRWNEDQILEEHRFLLDLFEAEIPVVPPLASPDGQTLLFLEDLGIYFSVFPKVGGRIPDELTFEQLEWAGRTIARIHNVGALREAPNRIRLDQLTYGESNLEFLLAAKILPEAIVDQYCQLVNSICAVADEMFSRVSFQRIHGDCHMGNLIWNPEGLFLVDFDDMLNGPAVQDLWLLNLGRDDESLRQRDCLLEGYEQMRGFDYESLELVELLRSLRMIHFTAWIAKRWEDPSFKRAFPSFGDNNYWREQIADLSEQYEIIVSGAV